MERSKVYSVFFVLLITVFWGFVLSFAYTALRDAQVENEILDRRSNILIAVGLMDRDSLLPANEINDIYEKSLQSLVVDHEGRPISGISGDDIDLEVELKKTDPKEWRLPIYVVKADDGGQASVYAIPVHGKGLWSTLYGYLALESDLDTIKGMTFYKQGETAGLGAEIAQPWFQENFVGKKIFDGEVLRSIEVVKGKVEQLIADPDDQIYAVDGISGASITGRGVADLLKEKLSIYEPYIKRVRAEKL